MKTEEELDKHWTNIKGAVDWIFDVPILKRLVVKIIDRSKDRKMTDGEMRALVMDGLREFSDA